MNYNLLTIWIMEQIILFSLQELTLYLHVWMVAWNLYDMCFHSNLYSQLCMDFHFTSLFQCLRTLQLHLLHFQQILFNHINPNLHNMILTLWILVNGFNLYFHFWSFYLIRKLFKCHLLLITLNTILGQFLKIHSTSNLHSMLQKV